MPKNGADATIFNRFADEQQLEISFENLQKENLFEKTNTIYRMQQGTPLIDFAGPGLIVYQVTIRAKHDVSFEGVKKLLLASGHVCKDKNNTTIGYSDCAKTGKICFYWVVPEGKESDWAKKKKSCTINWKTDKKGVNVNNNIKEFWNSCFSKFVDQYYLVLDKNANKVNEIKKYKKGGVKQYMI